MREELRAFYHYTLGKYFAKKPVILTLFVTNLCNARCQHCFYWQNLGKEKELEKLSRDLGYLELLLFSGGEPFLRDDLAEIVKIFWRRNHLKTVSIVTNSLLSEKIAKETERILKISPHLLVIVPLSLDGTRKIHDQVRGIKGAFEKVQETSRRLFKLKKKYQNLRIRYTATVFNLNYENLFGLIDQMPRLFPESKECWALSLNLMRGKPRNPDLKLPPVAKLKKLFTYKTEKFKEKRPWATRILEKVIFAAQIKILEEKKQIVPCEAGRVMAVVYEDGAVGHCELLPAVGSLKKRNFNQIWQSKKAKTLREKIIEKKCFCTHECNLFPSLIAHPLGWLKLIGLALKLR